MKNVLAILLAVMCGCLLASVEAAEIDASDPRIQYVGRWHRADTASPWCAWQSSAIRVRFHGAAVRVELESGTTEYARVIIDGDSASSKKIKLSPGKNSYVLAEELDLGVHQVEFVKETYSGEGRLRLHGLKIEGELLKPQSKPPKMRIEFYGDSNLAGQSLESEKDQHGLEFVGCHFTFAGIASRMLDAEYQNISVGGAIIAGKPNSVMSFQDRMDFYHAEPKFDFASFPVDVCVINIGANDVPTKTKEQIKAAYKTIIVNVRKVRPTAHIVLMNGYGWDRREPANYTDEVIEEVSDPNLSRLVFPWLFNEWHGCEYDHAGMAVQLVEHLEALNPAWKRLNECDVMNGFARDGSVANGGFEQVAPFGGYGWRYSEDGAERIVDSESAAEGKSFLRLPEGKEVHQPQPTSRGKRHEIGFQLRGNAGARARVRIEFRDQDYRNEIEGSAIEFLLDATPKWTDTKIDFVSPVGSKTDVSRQPWKAILRLKSVAGTVDFDNVKMLND